MEEYTRSEEFSHYMESFEFFFTADGIEDALENTGRRKDIQLIVVGFIRDLLAQNRSINKNYSEIVELLKNHFQPKSSVVVQRYKLYTRARKNEPIANFVVDLGRLSEDCD